MSHILFALPILIVLTSQELAQPSTSDLRSFEAARADARNDPAKLVKLTLWCEAHGMRAERRAMLEEAVHVDPNNKAAHGLLGQISYQGRWETPESVTDQLKKDDARAAKIAEYYARRARIDHDTEIERREIAAFEKAGFRAKASEVKLRLDRRIEPEQVRLGLWCEQHGLKPEAQAHFTTALHLNPHNEATWRHLGYIKHHGRWLTHQEIAAENQEALAQKHADRHWEPRLHKWAAELSVPGRSSEAEANLAKVSDPLAVASIVRLFGETPAGQKLAVRLLGQIDAPASSRWLAVMAVNGDEPGVRDAAARALKGREPRDFAEWIVNLIRTPMTYQIQPVGGPGSRGALVIDSPRFRVLRTYDAPAAFRLSSTFNGYVGYDPNGLPTIMTKWDLRDFGYATQGSSVKQIHLATAETILRNAEYRMAELQAEAQFKALVARERLAADVRELEELNEEAKVLNQRVEEVLRVAMDAPRDLGDDDENAWSSWYYERIGYRYEPPTKVVAVVNAVPQLPAPFISSSCFQAGTPVRTLEGPRPIESLSTGDQVLSRDVATGALAYRSVLAVHHNPSDKTLRIALDNGDAIVVSRFHRFWLPGRGWALARDLKPGQALRTLGGPARITSIDQAPVQFVFNLDVAEYRTYFVGDSAILVHDNSLPPPHAAAPPFDRIVELAALSHK